ncbi:unnamed protein product, partial [Discosporangium mesarthrocarpum]
MLRLRNSSRRLAGVTQPSRAARPSCPEGKTDTQTCTARVMDWSRLPSGVPRCRPCNCGSPPKDLVPGGRHLMPAVVCLLFRERRRHAPGACRRRAAHRPGTRLSWRDSPPRRCG